MQHAVIRPGHKPKHCGLVTVRPPFFFFFSPQVRPALAQLPTLSQTWDRHLGFTYLPKCTLEPRGRTQKKKEKKKKKMIDFRQEKQPTF